MSKPQHEVYLDTVDRLEPDITMVDTGAAMASIAISLKRIADALEGVLSDPDGCEIDIKMSFASHAFDETMAPSLADLIEKTVIELKGRGLD